MATKRKPKAKPKAKRKLASDLPPVRTVELATMLGVTGKTIAAWAAAGVVKRIGYGKFDLALSVQGFAKHMKALAEKGGDASVTVAAERALLLKVQRQRGELELAKSRGDLVSSAEIMEEFRKHCLIVQREIAMVPGYLMNRIVGIDREVVQMIDEKLREAAGIIEDGGSLSDHKGYDREGRRFYPVPDGTEELIRETAT
jgi:phage terminase Nu1 subunit (DNA packaging protein)